MHDILTKFTTFLQESNLLCIKRRLQLDTCIKSQKYPLSYQKMGSMTIVCDTCASCCVRENVFTHFFRVF